MKGIVASIGTDKRKAFIYEYMYKLTPEANKKYQDMFKVYIEAKTTPEDFVTKFKDLVVKAADQYIKENPDTKVLDYVDKVKR